MLWWSIIWQSQSSPLQVMCGGAVNRQPGYRARNRAGSAQFWLGLARIAGPAPVQSRFSTGSPVQRRFTGSAPVHRFNLFNRNDISWLYTQYYPDIDSCANQGIDRNTGSNRSIGSHTVRRFKINSIYHCVKLIHLTHFTRPNDPGSRFKSIFRFKLVQIFQKRSVRPSVLSYGLTRPRNIIKHNKT